MSDFGQALIGGWRFERTVTDGNAMSGTARFEPESDGTLRYREEGLLTLRDRTGPPLHFSRGYFYRFAGAALTILFDEPTPRLFEEIALSGDAANWQGTGFHPCGHDRYRSRYALDHDGFHTVHHVQGPRKSYSIETRYTRL